MQSTDTDSDTCRVRFYDSSLSGVSNYYQIPRGDNVSVQVTLTDTASQMWIIPAVDTASIQEGDIMTFSGAMICTLADWQTSQTYEQYVPTNEELFDIIINNTYTKIQQ